MEPNKEFIFNGKITFVGNLETGVSKSGQEWSKQWFTVEANAGRYTQRAAFNLMGNRLSENASILRVGNEVAVHFDTDYREKKDQNTGAITGFYPDIIAYQVDLLSESSGSDNF